MDIILLNLAVRCRKEIYNVGFSAGITYFYGKMGAGKSTILHLVDFCLGNELIETPALQQEFIGADLHLELAGKNVELSRDKGSNQVNVTWVDYSGESFNVLAPTKSSSEAPPLLLNTKVQVLSDIIFYLCGMEPPKVRKSKLKEDTELIRLSFRDIMWYCYLDQDEIDSSFFYLGRDEHDYKRLKSRDVMRLILGFHQEEVALLESQLYETRQRKSTLLETAVRIEKFLNENSIANTEEIENELFILQNELDSKKLEVDNLRDNIQNENRHLTDEFKSKAREYSRGIEELTEVSFDLKEQIERRKKLHNEYNIASVKVSRSNSAKELLKGVDFCNCPRCGQDLLERVELEHICSLCMQEYADNTNAQEVELLKADLKIRQNELKDSIIRLERQLSAVEKERSLLVKNKLDLDTKLIELEKVYDSAFLAKARELERQIGEYEGRRKELNNLLPLPKRVEQVYLEVADLAKEEERLKNALMSARRFAEMDASNLEELKSLFIENLSTVGFPGIDSSDYIDISTTDFIPRITRSAEEELFTTEFANLGSGGKKTIFKCCFILAIHRLAKRKNIHIPTFIMIDTPMKNISERENRDIFEGFYNLIYQLYSNELSENQLIIVDKEFFSPEETDYKEYYTEGKLKIKHMTPDDRNNPPLIQYYKGH
jgi:hypothetical protein